MRSGGNDQGTSCTGAEPFSAAPGRTPDLASPDASVFHILIVREP